MGAASSGFDSFLVLLITVLGHSLWQALLVMLVLWTTLRFLRSDQVQARYAMCAFGLTLTVTAVCLTAALLTLGSPEKETASTAAAGPLTSGAAIGGNMAHDGAGHYGRKSRAARLGTDSAQNTASDLAAASPPDSRNIALDAPSPGATKVNFRGNEQTHEIRDYPAPQLVSAMASPYPWRQIASPWLAAAWAAGVLIMLVRCVVSLHGANDLKQAGRPVTDGPLWQALVELRQRLAISTSVTLRVYDGAVGPVVVGALRPVLLLPVIYMTHASPDMIRAVIAHELAHVRRYDFVVNLMQMVIESLLFFNPCVWWISNQMRVEREACCDQIAQEVAGGAHAYASTLLIAAQWNGAADVMAGASSTAALALARGPRSSLAERVKRLLWPGSHPRVRMPWYSVLAAFGLSCGVLACVWSGGLASVALAKALTSQERLERVERDAKVYGTPPGLVDFDDNRMTTISGAVKLAGGATPEKTVTINMISRRPRFSSGGGIPTQSGGRFKEQVAWGSVYLCAQYPGYAPAFAGPLETQPDGETSDVVLLLDHGFRSEIHVADENGSPQAQVSVKLKYAFPDALNPLFQQAMETDENGTAVVEHATTYPVLLSAEAPGFQPLTKSLEQLPRNAPVLLHMRKALVTTGTVVDGGTGKPITGAALLLDQKRGPDGNWTSNLTTATITDQNGRFVLSNLRDDTIYDFAVTAPLNRPAWLTNVKAGDSDLRVVMGAPLLLQGRLMGDPEKARAKFYGDPNSYSGPSLTVSDWLKSPVNNTSHQRTQSVPLHLQDGIGTFSVGGLNPGNVQISWDSGVAIKDVNLDLHTSKFDLELSTRPNEGPGKDVRANQKIDNGSTRTVVLRFAVPDGAPAPGGTFMLNYKGLPGDPNSGQNAPIPITGKEMRFVVQVPSGVVYRPDGTQGYYFPEGRFQVEKGTEESVHVIECEPAGSISGIVIDENGDPVQNVNLSVDIISSDQASSDLSQPSLYGTLVSPQGRFQITPAPLGRTYQVTASRGNYVVVSDPMALTGVAPTQLMTIQIGKGHAVEGTVVDETGRPLSGIPVRFTLEVSSGSTHHLQMQVTDRDGRFRVEGINPAARGKYFIDVLSQKDFQPRSLQIDPAKSPFRIVLKRGMTIRGHVMDAAGHPVKDVKLTAVPMPSIARAKGPWFQSRPVTTTDAEGNFIFSNLDEGTYTIRITTIGKMGEVTATAGSDEMVQLRLQGSIQ